MPSFLVRIDISTSYDVLVEAATAAEAEDEAVYELDQAAHFVGEEVEVIATEQEEA